MTKQQIVNDFLDYLSKNGGSYNDWYVGITNDPKKRLFTEHNVDEQYGKWIYAAADTNQAARSVEDYFIDLGCDGGSGGGDNSSTVVYAYKKTSYTNP